MTEEERKRRVEEIRRTVASEPSWDFDGPRAFDDRAFLLSELARLTAERDGYDDYIGAAKMAAQLLGRAMGEPLDRFIAELGSDHRAAMESAEKAERERDGALKLAEHANARGYAEVSRLEGELSAALEANKELTAERDCLRIAHGFMPLSLREAVRKRDLGACRAWAVRCIHFMEQLQAQRDFAVKRAEKTDRYLNGLGPHPEVEQLRELKGLAGQIAQHLVAWGEGRLSDEDLAKRVYGFLNRLCDAGADAGLAAAKDEPPNERGQS